MEEININEILENENISISDEELDDVLKSKEVEAEEILKDEKKTNKVLEKALKLCERLGNIPLIGKLFIDVPLLCYMIKDYKKGNYRDVPIATIITALAALIYFVSPIDIIPDFIPIIGKIDDALIIGLALGSIDNDITSYKSWKDQNIEVVSV